jgi:hypothetical protein
MLEGTGSVAIIEFYTLNTKLEIDSGMYQIALSDTMFTYQDCTTDYDGDGLMNQDDCFYNLPDGAYFISEGSVYNGNNTFQSGNIHITKDGEFLIIEFSCTGENGDEFTGYYYGSPRYYDYSSRK